MHLIDLKLALSQHEFEKTNFVYFRMRATHFVTPQLRFTVAIYFILLISI